MTLVMKFGGTSVGSSQAIAETAVLIQQTKRAWGQVVVVASGMGSKPVKVTDLLLNGATSAAEGDAETFRDNARLLRQIHQEAIAGLLGSSPKQDACLAENGQFIDRFEMLCQAISVLHELSPRALDAIAGMGEQMSARILAASLNHAGIAAEAIDATELIVTDNNYMNASPLWEETQAQVGARLRPLLDQGIIPIVTGFIGATQEGVTTTLGRGGSDYTAAILGQALGSDEVWIWTDVDGVMTTDPRIVAAAVSIPVLSYREVSELAFYGAKVIHPKTMRPCVDNDIPLRIKNTFNPDHPGTVIVPDANGANGGIKAVTAITDLSLITIEGKGMLGVPGIAARTFGAVAQSGQSVLLISQASSEQSICFAATQAAAAAITASLLKEFSDELQRQDIDQIWAHEPVAIITVVGAGMRHTPGISGRVFTALGQIDVNVIAIAQGSSECSISIVVDETDATTAVSEIHQLIGKGAVQPAIA